MKILSLYRITSHQQTVEVDDVSMSQNKVSNQVLFIQKKIPAEEELQTFLKGTSIGTIVLVDSFNEKEIIPFDHLLVENNPIKITHSAVLDGQQMIIGVPEDFLSFQIDMEIAHRTRLFTVKVITLSDRAHRGIYSDRSGPLAVEMIEDFFKKTGKKVKIEKTTIPDSAEKLIGILETARDQKTDLLITTGGTGIGKRDITVETVTPFIDKEIPGIMEMIRIKYGSLKPNALLSRGIAGVMNQTLVYTLPGSEKAVKEYLTEIFLTLDHLFYMLHGIDNH